MDPPTIRVWSAAGALLLTLLAMDGLTVKKVVQQLHRRCPALTADKERTPGEQIVEGWRDGGMEGWRDGGMDGWTDGGRRTDGRMEGWRDGGMDGWMDGQTE